jgi:hypothetical protein
MLTNAFRALAHNTICTIKRPGQKRQWVIVWYVIPSGVVFKLPDSTSIEVPNDDAQYVESMEGPDSQPDMFAGINYTRE